MVDSQSYFFDFQRSPSFFDKWNIDFLLEDMNSSNNFEVCFVTYSPTNIEDCLNDIGQLNSEVTIQSTIPCSLKWENNIISFRNDVTWSINDTWYPLKAVFVRDATSKFVMGYSINVTPFEVTNSVVLEENTILWSIQDG